MSGRMLDGLLGTIQFWIFLIGTNLTFFPMHLLGLLGMPRRVYTYAPNLGWDDWNLASSIGAFLLGIGVLVFIANWFNTVRKPADAPADPWGAYTLGWATASPPPPEDFETIPPVRSARPLWDAKHPQQADWRTATG
jgi:cytochrome c oxidase subunit 1